MAEENRNSGGTVGGGAQSRADRNRAESAAQAAKMRSRNHEINRGVRGETDEFETRIHHGERAGRQEHVPGGREINALMGSGRPARDTPNHDSIQRGRPIRDTPNHSGPVGDLVGLWGTGNPVEDTPNYDSVQRGRPIRDTPNPSSPLDDLIGLFSSGRPAQDTPNPDYQIVALLKALSQLQHGPSTAPLP